jgi:hypothetical protein
MIIGGPHSEDVLSSASEAVHLADGRRRLLTSAACAAVIRGRKSSGVVASTSATVVIIPVASVPT